MGGWDRYQNKGHQQRYPDQLRLRRDGGGGPTRRMLETSKRMEKGIKGVPKVRQAFARTYFDELHEKVKTANASQPGSANCILSSTAEHTPRWHATNAANRKSEYAMMELELLSVLAESTGKAYPTEELNRMWEMILTNQFHDILPGSSIHEVYEQTKKEYAEIAETSAKLIGERMEALCGTKDESVTVWNTSATEETTLLYSGETAAEAMTDGTTVYPVQQTKDGAIVYAENLPSKGYQVLRPTSGAAAETPFCNRSWRGLYPLRLRSTRSRSMQTVNLLPCLIKRTTAKCFRAEQPATSCVSMRTNLCSTAHGTWISSTPKILEGGGCTPHGVDRKRSGPRNTGN